MIILALDPAISGPLGVAVLGTATGVPRLIARGAYRPKAKAWEDRLGELGAVVLDGCQRYRPDALAFEAAWLGKNLQTTRKLSLAGGVVVGVALARGLRWAEVQPVEGKLALSGDAGADGAAMVVAALRQFGQQMSEHEAHAIGVALHAAAVLRRAAMVREAVRG